MRWSPSQSTLDPDRYPTTMLVRWLEIVVATKHTEAKPHPQVLKRVTSKVALVCFSLSLGFLKNYPAGFLSDNFPSGNGLSELVKLYILISSIFYLFTYLIKSILILF